MTGQEGISRRELIGHSVAAASLPWTADIASSGGPFARNSGLVDTNVSLFQWPFRRLPLDETPALVDRLKELGVTEAWAGSFEAILHRDLSSVNQRLADACRDVPELRPVGAINVSLPDWQTDVRRCVDDLGIRILRIVPGYHGVSLRDGRLVELARVATDRGCCLQLCVTLEDRRTQHPLVRVPDIDLSSLGALVAAVPGLRLQLLNATLGQLRSGRLDELPTVCVDTARVDGTDGLVQLLQMLPVERILFGSHAPFLIPEAALLRIEETEPAAEACRGMLGDSARAFLRGTNE